jgi:2-iminoacetate synthase
MTSLVQLQARAERERVTSYEPEFRLDLQALDDLSEWSRRGAREADVERAVRAQRRELPDLAALLSPTALKRIEDVASAAHHLTVRRFGRTMHLFAPLYLSNECVSECTYCGFRAGNRDIVRRTLEPAEVREETRRLTFAGFRHVLLVSGEHPRHVNSDYIAECVRRCAEEVPNVSVEVQAFDRAAYELFIGAGCEGLVIYQESYDPRTYGDFHLKGNKRFFDWRLGSPERGAEAGMRRLGIGTLLGLNPDWRFEVLALAAHARFLMKRFWRCELTVALPRLEPAAGFDRPPQALTDAEFALALAALRLALPDAGIVLSTRERPRLRDGLARLGVTHMSAGSRTEPGGYSDPGGAQEQFKVSDERPVADVVAAIRRTGYDPVWKESSPALRRAWAEKI